MTNDHEPGAISQFCRKDLFTVTMEPCGRDDVWWRVVIGISGQDRKHLNRVVMIFEDKQTATAEQQAMGIYLYLSAAEETVVRLAWATGCAL